MDSSITEILDRIEFINLKNNKIDAVDINKDIRYARAKAASYLFDKPELNCMTFAFFILGLIKEENFANIIKVLKIRYVTKENIPFALSTVDYYERIFSLIGKSLGPNYDIKLASASDLVIVTAPNDPVIIHMFVPDDYMVLQRPHKTAPVQWMHYLQALKPYQQMKAKGLLPLGYEFSYYKLKES